jgi:hypothetical protein
MLGRIEIPRLLGKYDELRRDFAFEARLRRAVLEELAPHRGRGRGRLQASRALAPQAAVVTALDRLYVSVVRTR